MKKKFLLPELLRVVKVSTLFVLVSTLALLFMSRHGQQSVIMAAWSIYDVPNVFIIGACIVAFALMFMKTYVYGTSTKWVIIAVLFLCVEMPVILCLLSRDCRDEPIVYMLCLGSGLAITLIMEFIVSFILLYATSSLWFISMKEYLLPKKYEIYEGRRGGRYRLSKGGNRVYVKS